MNFFFFFWGGGCNQHTFMHSCNITHKLAHWKKKKDWNCDEKTSNKPTEAVQSKESGHLLTSPSFLLVNRLTDRLSPQKTTTKTVEIAQIKSGISAETLSRCSLSRGWKLPFMSQVQSPWWLADFQWCLGYAKLSTKVMLGLWGLTQAFSFWSHLKDWILTLPLWV